MQLQEKTPSKAPLRLQIAVARIASPPSHASVRPRRMLFRPLSFTTQTQGNPPTSFSPTYEDTHPGYTSLRRKFSASALFLAFN